MPVADSTADMSEIGLEEIGDFVPIVPGGWSIAPKPVTAYIGTAPPLWRALVLWKGLTMYPVKITPETVPNASVRARMTIERRIVRRLLSDLLSAGCELSVCDGEEMHPWTTSMAQALDALMNTDEDTLYVRRADGPKGGVLLVYGNDGYDVICDYSMALEPLLKGVNAYAETFED